MSKKTEKAPKTIPTPTHIPKQPKIFPWSTLDALGSFLSALVAAFAIFIGISQFKSQTNELKYEREQLIKLDRPILSIDKNSVSEVNGIAEIKLVIKNVGIRPAYNLGISTIVVRTNTDSLHMVYNQKDYSVNYANPIFKEQEVNFFNKLLIVKNAEYFIKATIHYYEEKGEDGYKQDFYFKWKHSENKEYLPSLYGIERELTQQIDEFILKYKNKEK